MFSELDSLDHVFITAGTLLFDPKLVTDAKSVRPALDTRFWGAFNAAKFAAAKMGTGGSITFMSGTAAIRPIRGASVATAAMRSLLSIQNDYRLGALGVLMRSPMLCCF